MITTSAEYKTEVWQNDNRQFLHYAVVTLTDGTVINLDNTNIWQGGFRLEEAVSSESGMEVGSCIASELTLIINNINGTYDGIDFEGASVVASIGLMVNGSEERFLRCTAHVDEMETTGSLITLTCLDAMVKFDKDYSASTLAYPATLAQIVTDACAVCGVPLVSSTFPNSNYIVTERPENATLTFREVLSYALQIGCSFARINPFGQLEIRRLMYKGSTWAELADYTWAELADIAWNEPPIIGADLEIEGYSSFRVDFRRCSFTGVEVTVDDNSVLVGNDTYVMKVENNPLVSSPSAVATLMYPYILGLSFWPYEAEHLSDPSLQAGDSVLIRDNKGNEYYTLATNISYSAGNYETTGCYAQSYPRNESNRYSPAAVAEARASKAASNYVDLLANSFGLFRSEIPDPVLEGAYTYALHNAQTYDTSTFAMIANVEGLYVQTRSSASDTWTTTASVVSNGDALVNVLTAIGIKAGWIKVGGSGSDGTLYIYDTNDNVIGEWGNRGIKIYAGAIEMTSLDASADVISLSRTTSTGGYNTTIKARVGAGFFTAQSVGTESNSLEIYRYSVSNENIFLQYCYGEKSGQYYSGNYYSITMLSHIIEFEEGNWYTDGTGDDEETHATRTAQYTIDGYEETSDARLKENIDDMPKSAIDFLKALRPVEYNLKGTGERKWGFVAQEVLQAREEHNAQVRMVGTDRNGYYNLNTATIIPVMTAVIQENEKRITELETRLKALEERFFDDGR